MPSAVPRYSRCWVGIEDAANQGCRLTARILPKQCCNPSTTEGTMGAGGDTWQSDSMGQQQLMKTVQPCDSLIENRCLTLHT